MITPPDRAPDLEIVGYLHRWFLVPQNSSTRIYLHHILKPDIPILHDHPWSFQSTVLNGGYTEQRADGSQMTYGLGETHKLLANDSHYICDVAPDTWTLVVTGPYEHTWYFYPPGKKVRHVDFHHPERSEVIVRNAYYGEDRDVYR